MQSNKQHSSAIKATALFVEDLRMRLDAASEAKIQAEILKETETGAVQANLERSLLGSWYRR